MAKITVIIPSYNMHEKAVRAIDSVLIQDVNLKIIVIDDCSNPPLELPARILNDGRVSLIRQKVNSGVSAARNIAIEMSETPWLTFLDSDDQLIPGTLECRLKFAEDTMAGNPLEEPQHEYTNAFVCCGWIESAGENGQARIRIPNPADKTEEFATGCWYCPGSCAIFHRTFFDGSNRKYDQSLRRLEDFDLGVRIGLSGGKMYSHPIAGVKIRPSNRADSAMLNQTSQMFQEKYDQLKSTHPRVYSNLMAYLALERTTFFFRENNWLKAAIEITRSYWWCPRLKLHFSPGWSYKKWREEE